MGLHLLYPLRLANICRQKEIIPADTGIYPSPAASSPFPACLSQGSALPVPPGRSPPWEQQGESLPRSHSFYDLLFSVIFILFCLLPCPNLCTVPCCTAENSSIPRHELCFGTGVLRALPRPAGLAVALSATLCLPQFVGTNERKGLSLEPALQL